PFAEPDIGVLGDVRDGLLARGIGRIGTAGEGAVGLPRTPEVAGRVALLAVTRPFHEIGAAVPGGVPGGIGLEAGRLEEGELPGMQAPALAVGEAELVRLRRLTDRGYGVEIGLECPDIL